ncbi:MAG: hypothetical protein AAB502_04030, partial [Chloroflexota bacterium]
QLRGHMGPFREAASVAVVLGAIGPVNVLHPPLWFPRPSKLDGPVNPGQKISYRYPGGCG